MENHWEKVTCKLATYKDLDCLYYKQEQISQIVAKIFNAKSKYKRACICQERKRGL